MPNDDAVHISDHTDHLGAKSFHLQLRRLESLQTLMTQGGEVVSEVAQFLVRAREELGAMQREQESYVAAQEQLSEEKALMAAKLSTLEKTAEEVGLRAFEQERLIGQLRGQLAATSETKTSEHVLLEERCRVAEDKVAAAQKKIAMLELALRTEREASASAPTRVRQDEVDQHAAEIALMKSRLAAVEQQLETERDRRSRLMEVVKKHELAVNGRGERQREVTL